ncbi:MAG: YdcF family protein [Pseudoxanthomonas sp.]
MRNSRGMPYFMFSPLTWGLLCGLLLLLGWRRFSPGIRGLGVAMGLMFLVMCMPAGANLLEYALESQVSESAACTPRDTGPVVVLSGGFEFPPTAADDYASFTLETWTRTRAATDLWHKTGTGELWISGGGPFRFKESEMQARVAADWKVPVSALRIESESTTTRESAVRLAPVFVGRKVRLVTSPPHRVRALLAFQLAGIDTCVDMVGSDYATYAGPAYFLPQSSALEKAESALYEMVGILYYRFLDWRSSGH